MATNTQEEGLETLIVNYLVAANGYELGDNSDYDKEFAIDETRLFRFLQASQANELTALHILDSVLEKNKFLSQLSKELSSAGIIKLLRDGMRYKHLRLRFYHAIPSPQNIKAQAMYAQNIFSVTRQVRYSREFPKLALDFVVFINGLPVITFELKNLLTKQNVNDAVHQYRTDRDPKELIFNFKRCAVHFAMDEQEVMMCTQLSGKSSWFLPFNKGNNDGAGNPVNPTGLKTDYLWKDILNKVALSNIIENGCDFILM